MEQDKEKIREPYTPERTPDPPQIIDPSRKNERNEKEPPVKTEKEQDAGEDRNTGTSKEKKARAGDGSKPGQQQ